MSGEIEELLAAADGGKGLLAEDNIPDENQSLTCFSCGAELIGLYCHECGNKNDNYRRSILSLIIDLLGNITAVDSRMWRSLWSLFSRPGQMAREFSDGARTRWTSPVRMYLATSLLLFGYIAFSGTQLVAIGSVVGENKSDGAAAIHSGSQSQRLLFFVEHSKLADITSESAQAQSETFIRGFMDVGDRINNPENMRDGIEELNDRIEDATSDIERRALTATRDQLARQLEAVEASEHASTPPDPSETGSDNQPNDENADESDGENSINISGLNGESFSLGNDDLATFYRRIVRNPEVINDSLNSNLKFAMFFMLPFAMLLGAVFIRGRDKAMLYDHLVHAAYVHAFSFILLFVFILLKQYTAMGGLLFLYTVILLIYLPISAKGMFGRGWFKSFLTAYGVGAVYTFNMMVLSVFFVATALTGVAKEIAAERLESTTIITPSTPTPESAVSPQPDN